MAPPIHNLGDAPAAGPAVWTVLEITAPEATTAAEALEPAPDIAAGVESGAPPGPSPAPANDSAPLPVAKGSLGRAECPESSSRFNRARSVRMSAAVW